MTAGPVSICLHMFIGIYMDAATTLRNQIRAGSCDRRARQAMWMATSGTATRGDSALIRGGSIFSVCLDLSSVVEERLPDTRKLTWHATFLSNHPSKTNSSSRSVSGSTFPSLIWPFPQLVPSDIPAHVTGQLGRAQPRSGYLRRLRWRWILSQQKTGHIS